jgi:hypothetical protein
VSRTDTHAPYWTWAQWYEPDHSIYCEFYLNRSWQKTAKQPCTLPDRAVRHHDRFIYRRRPGLCNWTPVWPTYPECRWLMFGKAARSWFVDHVWHNPERVRTRDQLRNLAREYNAYGDLEDGDFPNWQARNCARWSWD